ncbi:MAG: hypothetical protein ACOYNY_25525 [Caldilineaceae bacterium]
MTLNEIMQDIIALEEDLLLYERKYGIPSDIFYASFSQGDEPPDDAWVLDWGGWAGTYQILQRRRKLFAEQIERLQQKTSLIDLLEKAARRKPIPLAA